MEGKNYQIVNWKIENLNCWNQALHGKCIESSGIHLALADINLKLYPRGTSGQEEHIVVHLLISGIEEDISGDLSFIGADGSALCTQRLDPKKDASDVEFPPGPKFEEVTAQLFMRLKIESACRYYECHVGTIIQVFDVTLAVDRFKILGDIRSISSMRYDHDDHASIIHLKTGKSREDKKIELYLVSETIDTPYSVKTHLSLISCERSSIRYEKNEHLFERGGLWKFSNSLSEEELSENTRLILNFKIIFKKVIRTFQNVYLLIDDAKIISIRNPSVCMENSHGEKKTESPKDRKRRKTDTHNIPDNASAVGVLTKELRCLYQDQDFSDLQLKCGNVSFPVHKAILSARSTVFKSMLSSNMMAQAATGCLDIANMDAATLARFLTFLYTGAVEDLQVGGSALKLYYAADKYNVLSLKSECVRFLRTNVCVTNVSDALLLGDKHQDDELVAAAHNFILRNYNEVVKSEEWKYFMCTEPYLAKKTLTAIFGEKNLVGNLNAL